MAFRRQHTALVEGFERSVREAAQLQQPAATSSQPGSANGQAHTAAQPQQGAEGAPSPVLGSAALPSGVAVSSPQPAGAGALSPAADALPTVESSDPLVQFAAMQQIVRDQARVIESLLAQQQQLAAASPAGSPALPPVQESRFARALPRAQDLREYDGAAGVKLDEWLQELALAVGLHALNPLETTTFAASRLRGAALQWWLALGVDERAAMTQAGALAAALRARFQPVTASRLAREHLDKLQQGSRHINDYIAEFQRLHTALPSMTEEEALHVFERGLRRDLAEKLRIQGVTTLSDAIGLAARVGGIVAAASSSSSSHAMHPSRANQMEMDSSIGATAQMQELIERSVLNALHMQQSGASASSSGVGAKTQTQRGYASNRGGARGGARGGRGGRFGGQPRPPMEVPGVPASVVSQRLEARQCVRCGDPGHLSYACPNAISALGN